MNSFGVIHARHFSSFCIVSFTVDHESTNQRTNEPTNQRTNEPTNQRIQLTERLNALRPALSQIDFPPRTTAAILGETDATVRERRLKLERCVSSFVRALVVWWWWW